MYHVSPYCISDLEIFDFYWIKFRHFCVWALGGLIGSAYLDLSTIPLIYEGIQTNVLKLGLG